MMVKILDENNEIKKEEKKDIELNENIITKKIKILKDNKEIKIEDNKEIKLEDRN